MDLLDGELQADRYFLQFPPRQHKNISMEQASWLYVYISAYTHVQMWKMCENWFIF